jgi:ankyrin repeat protein
MDHFKTAIITGDLETVEQFLNQGIDPNMTFHENRGSGKPLTLAIEMGQTAVAKLLLDRGADPNSSGHHFGASCMSGRALVIASMLGNNEIIEILLALGVPINHPIGHSCNGSPLHYAVTFNHLETVKLLINRGADVNSINPIKSTSLSPDIALLLLENGANINHRISSKEHKQ